MLSLNCFYILLFQKSIYTLYIIFTQNKSQRHVSVFPKSKRYHFVCIRIFVLWHCVIVARTAPPFFQFGLMLFSLSSRRRQQGFRQPSVECPLRAVAVVEADPRKDKVLPASLASPFGGEKVVKRFQWDFECFSCCKSYLPPTQNSELFPLPHAVLTTIIISAWESIEKYTNTHIRCSLALHLYLSLYFMDLCMTPSCIFCCVSLPSMSLYLLIFRKYLRYMASV